jgi:hypothetical protein
MLFWEHNGFWLFYRRLERGTFQWPVEPKAATPMSITLHYLYIACSKPTVNHRSEILAGYIQSVF